MKSATKFAIAVVLTLCSSTLNAQDVEKCAVETYMNQLRQHNRVRQSKQQFEQWLQSRQQARIRSGANERRQVGPYKIPVVVHIIHNGEAVGTGTNISDAQIISQIDVINNDFRRLNADKVNTPAEFVGVAGALDIEFVLARQSPQGLPTSGIVRVQGSKSSWPLGSGLVDTNGNGVEDFKEQSYWPAEDYFNIWVVKSSNAYLGYAQFPISNLPGLAGESEDNRLTDGVVMHYEVFGTIDAGPFQLDGQYNLGRTLTHEVGHFLGLRHIWGDMTGCSTDDYVSDTPLQSTAYVDECPSTTRTSCSTSDMYQNYLDYTDDACMNLFTVGQVDRMMLILDDPSVPRRNSLLTSHGLDDPICAPTSPVDVAILSLDEPGPVTCNSSPRLSVTLQNLSCPTVTDAKISWSVGSSNFTETFTGLSIASLESYTLSLGNISLTEGPTTISVIVDELNGITDSDNSNSDETFYFVRNSSRDIIPVRENFDNNSFNNWTVVNPENGLIWDLALTSTQFSARFASPFGSNGEESWLTSPVLDFSSATEASLFFDLNYTAVENKNDKLRVYISKDCGDTYATTTIDFQGKALEETNGRPYLDLSEFAGEDSIRVAFVATNATGANIYVDNIEFFVSKDNMPLDISELFVITYDDFLQTAITFNLPEKADVRMAIFDMMGRMTQDMTLKNVLNQTYQVELGSLVQGVYIFRFQIGSRVYSHKVLLRQ